MPQSAAHPLEELKTAPAASETGEAMRPAEMVERLRAGLSRMTERASARAEVLGAGDIAERAKAELSRITGLAADHVSAVASETDGWHVTVDMIELKRIPAATDVLAAYEAVLGPTGALVSYRRARRYFRDQMMEG